MILMSVLSVAPFTGAWIETCTAPATPNRAQGSHPSRVRGLKHCRKVRLLHKSKSHPSRVRGLKQSYHCGVVCGRSVAPFTGAWIETRKNASVFKTFFKSHPSRVRGLKPAVGRRGLVEAKSHPSRVRGLKLSFPHVRAPEL